MELLLAMCHTILQPLNANVEICWNIMKNTNHNNMNYADTIRYIKRIRKDIKKGRHDNLMCSTYISIIEDHGYQPLEIAARFLRRKGYAIDIRINVVPLNHLHLGKYLRCLRYVFINY